MLPPGLQVACGTMRWSWLSSPAVSLLSFLAALITVGQWLAPLARIPVRLAHGVWTIIASPYPLSIQLAISLDVFGGWLTYRLGFFDYPETLRACTPR